MPLVLGLASLAYAQPATDRSDATALKLMAECKAASGGGRNAPLASCLEADSQGVRWVDVELTQGQRNHATSACGLMARTPLAPTLRVSNTPPGMKD
jgi:hypothetical protein